MATHLALLRGINVGGRNKVPMAELRGVVTSLGHTGVTTYIQSGNVLFTTDERDTGKLASDLEAAITGSFGLKSSVVVLAREDLAGILDRNPAHARRLRHQRTGPGGLAGRRPGGCRGHRQKLVHVHQAADPV